MKTKQTLKILLSSALFIFAVMTAQAQVENGDYTRYDSDTQAPDTIDYVTLYGGGTMQTYYAEPDPAYHPNYNGGAGWVLNGVNTWTWTVPTNPGGATVTNTVPENNYVEITYPALGDYVVNVVETAGAAFGGCFDATPTVMNVTVVDPPTGTLSINPGLGWTETTANESYSICGNQGAQTVTLTFVENIPDAYAGYSFAVASKVEVLDGADAVVATPTAEAITQDFPATTAGRLKAGQVGTLTNAAFAAATPNFTYTFDSDALALVQHDFGSGAVDARTKYTYKVVRTSDLTNTDFTSVITGKTDHSLDNTGATTNYQAFAVSEVSFIINPTPSTGPIYHISNTWEY